MSLPDADAHRSIASSPPAPFASHIAKSPPLAFERTPNDVLVPPSDYRLHRTEHSTSPSAMGRRTPMSPRTGELDLQAILDQQAKTISLMHEAFNAERHVWSLEKERLYQRIGSLEHLLRNDDHYSPAKSPILSPSLTTGVVSPSSRSLAVAQTLPTIAEDDRTQPRSVLRHDVPHSIQLHPVEESEEPQSRRQSAVSFSNAGGLQVEEIPSSPLRVSPPPPENVFMAGHTPIRRPPTPPPAKMSMDGIEDTPTRNNTHINTMLTQRNDEDVDRALKGPLNMPELPRRPDASNFTLEALNSRLEQIRAHPEIGKPMVFSQPSPGLASPVGELATDEDSASTQRLYKSPDSEPPFAPLGTRASELPALSELSSTALSPTTSITAAATSEQDAREARVQADFEQGGIRLKKKTSTNFGTPLGFGPPAAFAARKQSQDNHVGTNNGTNA